MARSERRGRLRHAPGPWLLAAVPIALLCAIAVPLFNELPPPWPDEALFGQPPRALLDEGRLATPLLTGILPDAERRTYWVPPLYFVWIAGWFAAFGGSLSAMRAASLVAAGAALMLAFALARHTRHPASGVGLPLAAAVLVAIDPLFVRNSLVGRMDMLTLALMLGALVAITRRAITRRHLVISGVLSGLAVASHPLGLSAGAAIGLCLATGICRSPDSRLRSLLIFAGGWGAAVLPWLVYVLADPAAFAAQFSLQLQRKTGDTLATRWHRVVVDNSAGGFSPMFRLSGLAAGLIGLLVAARRAPHATPAFLTGSTFAVVSMWGNEMWYPASIVAFAAAGWVALASSSARVIRVAVMVLMLLLGAQAGARSLELLVNRGQQDFPAWVVALDRDVFAQLPAGTRIFVNSVPDPAASLIHTRPDLQWREFSPVPIDRATYGQWLLQMDVFLLGPLTPDRGAVEWIHHNRAEWREIVVDAGGLRARLIVSPGIATALN